MVKTHAQPYKHIIHVYVYKYNEQPVSQDSNNSPHTATQDSNNTRFSTGE